MKQAAGTMLTMLLGILIGLPILAVPVYGYDDYAGRKVDSQNPEVQRMIREVAYFPLENYLFRNLRQLYVDLSRRFRYDYSFNSGVSAWITISQMFRQRKGVCCDFARLYYSLLRGMGWPAHRIRIVYGPVYDLLDNYIGSWHAWVEIQTPSPEGTSLESFANQAMETLEGEQVTMGFNTTFVTLPAITQERIQQVRTLGWGTRDGWIPIDPTMGVCNYEIPLIGWLIVPWLPDLFLTFGYHTFLLAGCKIHLNEVYPYYSNADRKNPIWDIYTVTLQPQEYFNVSYLHSVELHTVRHTISSSVNSTLPIDFEARNPRMQVIDATSNVMTYSFTVWLDYKWPPPLFPYDLGIYWFRVHNRQTEPINVTFSRFSGFYIGWLSGEENINQTLYNEYSPPSMPISIIPCDQSGGHRDRFLAAEDAYVKGIGFPATAEVAIFVLPDGSNPIPSNAKTITYKTTESEGVLAITSVWLRNMDSGKYDVWVDINQNNVFDEVDVLNNQTNGVFAFRVLILGDIDGDERVDSTDLSHLSSAFGRAMGNQDWNRYCDFNVDLRVDVKDLHTLGRNYGTASD